MSTVVFIATEPRLISAGNLRAGDRLDWGFPFQFEVDEVQDARLPDSVLLRCNDDTASLTLHKDDVVQVWRPQADPLSLN